MNFHQEMEAISTVLSLGKLSGKICQCEWNIILSSMPRIKQRSLSRYFMEGMSVRRLVKGGTKHKCQGYQLFNNNIITI